MFQPVAIEPHQDNVSNHKWVTLNHSKDINHTPSLMDDLLLFQSDVQSVYREGRSMLASYWMKNEKALKKNKQKLQAIKAG
jgi:hypothetical protein